MIAFGFEDVVIFVFCLPSRTTTDNEFSNIIGLNKMVKQFWILDFGF